MLQRNTNQGFRYMGNARDIVDPSTVTQSIVGPVMQLPLEVSRMPVNPIDLQQPNPVPISTLISDLASASPKKRDEACSIPPIMMIAQSDNLELSDLAV